MFKLIMTMVSVWSLVYVTGCATRMAPSPDVSTETVTYEVFGMDCPGCHGGLEKNLLKITGVVDAVANWKEKMVTIHVQTGQAITATEIEAAIKKSNFTMGKRLD